MTESAQTIDLSIVIPVRDEEQTIPELVRRLTAVVSKMGETAEFIFVTDVNTDNTVEVLRDAHRVDPRVKMVKLATSSGQNVAAMAGLRASRGQRVVLMDGDLQDHPEDIPQMAQRMEEGFDVVYGVKERKDESALRNILSATFIRLLNRLSDYPLNHNTCMFRIMSRRTVDAICLFPEPEPVITGLVSLIGFPISSVPVTSGTRHAGETKYSGLRLMNLALSYTLSFSTKPLRMISIIGLIVSGFSFAYLVFALIEAIFFGITEVGWPTLVCLIVLIGGMQLFALGVIGEYIGRIFLQTKSRPLYIIDETLGDIG